MSMSQGSPKQRLAADAGIAIGPILFIIAILAILAAAIAAGSGSFTASTSSESNRTKASAIIQIGENLKIGMDRIMMENSLDPSSVDINVQNTSANNALFSPSGGGITAPSNGLANNPATDIWLFPTGKLPELGTSGGAEQLAILKVPEGVCDEIDNKALGNSTPAAADLANLDAATTSLTSGEESGWPYSGKVIGCVNNSNNSTGGFYFFQVLAVQ